MRTGQDASKEYGELLRTKQWLNKRRQILKRDGYRCCNCGSQYGLEVHHRQYHIIKRTSGFRKPWDYSDNNLVTLCARCHQVGHNKYKVPVFNI